MHRSGLCGQMHGQWDQQRAKLIVCKGVLNPRYTYCYTITAISSQMQAVVSNADNNGIITQKL